MHIYIYINAQMKLHSEYQSSGLHFCFITRHCPGKYKYPTQSANVAWKNYHKKCPLGRPRIRDDIMTGLGDGY
jgi:hypothetical protein